MGWDLYAYREQKQIIQLGRRLDKEEDKEDKEDKEYVGSHQLWKSWINSNEETWPDCLKMFWWHIDDYDSAKKVINNIRLYYPEDMGLLSFADWLEKFDTDIKFEISY